MGCEKSHSEVLAVKFDQKLRFLWFGEKRKKDECVLKRMESDGIIFINGQSNSSTDVSTWILLPEVVHLGTQIFGIFLAFWFLWRFF